RGVGRIFVVARHLVLAGRWCCDFHVLGRKGVCSAKCCRVEEDRETRDPEYAVAPLPPPLARRSAAWVFVEKKEGPARDTRGQCPSLFWIGGGCMVEESEANIWQRDRRKRGEANIWRLR
ncbi:unnamed protein product, partial [Laminaria digitata]